MPRLWNVDHQTAVLNHNQPGVQPGASHDFTAEEAKRLSGSWSKTDPRAGLKSEREFKQRRDKAADNPPAESGDKKE